MKQQDTSFQIISSCDLESPSLNSSSVTPANTDLNIGNNCSSKKQEIVFSYSDLKDEEKRKEISKFFVERYGFEEEKLMRVLKRLSRKDECGREGFTGYVRSLKSGDVHLEYIPITCSCESCPYCSTRKRKKFFMELVEKLEWYIKEGKELDFYTITYGRVEADKLLEAYADFTKKLRRLYNWRLGKRNIQRLKERAYEELKMYLSNIKDPRERESKKVMHEYLIEESFQKIWEAVNKGAQKFFEVFDYLVLKIELTYRDSFHIHAHGITVNTLSRFVWIALLKILGFGHIFDIRRVRSVGKVVNYLSKYLLKADENNFDSLEHEVVYEYTVYGRRKVREWGGEDYEKVEESEENYEEEIVYVLKLQLEMELRKHIGKLGKSLPGLKRIGGEFIFRNRKYFMYVDEYGRFVLDEKFFKEIEEGIMLGKYKVLYKFKRRIRKDRVIEEGVIGDNEKVEMGFF